ncbi:MAG TPA: cache domain-containing protein [Anaeromyxobacter sp.]|nr:cache domain-containing protein [Anaeromyxobacter sp.]
MRLLLASVLLVALAGGAAAADERATTKEAELLVKKAIDYYQKNGKDKAFAAFSDPQGPFVFRDLYIAAYDLNGKCVAHGQKKERIGKNLLADKDPDGKAFVAERIEVAKEKGSGWQEYKFMNPATKQVEQKVAYFERVDDFVIACGAYRK